MCAVLRETASEYGIENVSVVEGGWLDAAVEPTDVALCSHVVYVIEDIGAFVRKMDSHTRRLVMAIVFEASPLSQVYGLWEQVHGETRHALPSLPHFLPVLDELGIQPQVTELDQQPPRTFSSIHEAREAVARWLYVTPETDAMTRLDQALQDALREENGAWHIDGAQPLRPCLVSWETGRA